MKKFFDKSILQPKSIIFDSVEVTIDPASKRMSITDTDLRTKLTYTLWMDLATRNPELMMKSIPVPRGTVGLFQLTMTGEENVRSVIELMLASNNERHQNLAKQIKILLQPEPVIKPDSVVATVIPVANIMSVLDTDLKGGDKFTYLLWMDLASRNPQVMMQSIPVPKGSEGCFQFTVIGKENILNVIKLMLTSNNAKYQTFAEEIMDRYSFYFDGNQKSIRP
ncbi:hypothetical protein EP47_14260 [Legionella norrlandica]|uniref:Uncharacterized protein n=1 Tax=Legionella norrlandica TaxID=1498499 RepID=A0A0A2ST05_9GAMM|nr:hypothetical protein [Legionella norrlandica]KGP62841.1 hypothetical protein EP47_14260 [Legionella norrlandica]